MYLHPPTCSDRYLKKKHTQVTEYYCRVLLQISATVCFLYRHLTTMGLYSGLTQQAFGLLNKVTQKCFANLCSLYKTLMLKHLNV